MKLVKIKENHYVVVDDAEIKEGDYCTTHLNVIDAGKIHNSYTIFNPQNKEHLDMVKCCKRITHSTKPLGTPVFFTNAFESDISITSNGLQDTVIENWGCQQLSLEEVKELIGEVDVEKKVNEYFTEFNSFHPEYDEGLRIGFKKGYQEALEDNKKKKYTEEDVRKALMMALVEAFDAEFVPERCNAIISSLTQPKEIWEVELVGTTLKLK